MSADPTEAFLVSLGQAQLLDAAQLADVRAWVGEFRPDPPLLAKELTRRGLLTSFQVKEIYKGRAKELTIGSYRLVDLLGEGGMGRVFKATHLRLGRDVALKVIRKEKLANPVAVGRFRQEIHAAAQLSHPNVVMAFDAEEVEGGGLCLSMEYVEGTDLTKLIRANGPMPIPMACDAIRQAAVGLQHAFERGMVHRDVKPSNLLLTPRGQVKVLDLGLALLQESSYAGGENANRVTQEGFVLGTPDFLAPEQAQNPTGVDIRADVYALGATLFYLVTGRVPYEGATPTEKMLKHVTEPPPSLLKYLPDAPPQLGQLIAWIMAKRPDDRPQTPAQVALALIPFCPVQSRSFPMPAMPAAPMPSSMGYALPPQATPAAHPQPMARPVIPVQPTAINAAMGQPPAMRAMPQAIPAMPVNYPSMPAAPAGPSPFTSFDSPANAVLDDRPRKMKGARPDDEPRRKKRGDIDSIRVRQPKTRSNLPLVIFAGVAILILLLSVGSIVVYFVTREVQSAKPLEDKFENAYGMTMVKIEPGEFRLGSPESEERREDNEGPVGTVKLTQPFYMATTEVSQGQYLQLMGNSPSIHAKNYNRQLTNRVPVDSVTYENAIEFCRRLTGKESGHRPGWGYRLPTEAEWEYCARAKTTTPFAFGDKLLYQKHGAFLEEADDPYWETNPAVMKNRNMPLPIAAKAGESDKGFEDLRREPNAFGLFDMHGNLWEWCADYYGENFPEGERTDPTGPGEAAGGVRVIRGGAWNEPATKARSASRYFHDPRNSAGNIGFRAVYAKLPE